MRNKLKQISDKQKLWVLTFTIPFGGLSLFFLAMLISITLRGYLPSAGYFDLFIAHGLLILVGTLIFARSLLTERKINTRYRLLFENNPLPMWIFDLETLRFLEVNDAAVEKYGYSREEFLTLTAVDIRPTEDIAVFLEHLKKHNGLILNTEGWHHRLKNGTIIDVEVTSHVFTQNDQKRVFVVVRDITRRRQAERELQASQVRFRSLIENAPDGITLLNADGFLEYASPSTQWILGYSAEELIGKNPAWFTHPEDLPSLLGLLTELIQKPGSCITAKYRMLHKNGSWCMIESRITNLLAEPYVNALVFNYRDITEQTMSELALRESEDRYRTLAEAAQDAIFVFDREDRIQYVNSYAAGLINRSTEELIAQPRTLLFPGKLGSDLSASICGIFESGETVVTEGEVQYQEKSAWLSIHYVPIFDTDRKVQSVLGIARNITERKNMEQALEVERSLLAQRVEERTAELKRANRAKDEFLANMSHELRTPLNGILAFSEALLDQTRGPLNERQLKALNNIDASGRHLLELINDILDLSKIEAGKLTLQMDPVQVDDICQSSLTIIKEMASKKQLNVAYHSNMHDVSAMADPRRLKQILVNLLSNAVKFTPPGGEVLLDVDADPEKETIRFSVKDNGIGISLENQKLLFQPFFQIDSSLTRQQEGTGLGLVLLHRLVELHGGSVSLESHPGIGSQFTIMLPWHLPVKAKIGTMPAVDAPMQILAPTLLHGKKILLAEDNQLNIEAIGEYLEDMGYQLTVARDGREALAEVEKSSPDIIIMDIQMPVMDGLETIKHLRAQAKYANTPIIALTALAMIGDRELCLSIGANEYFSKPVRLSELAKTIECLLLAQMQ